MTGPAFLRRPDPEAFTLAELAEQWSDPVEAERRVIEFDVWSASFDARSPLNRDREEELLRAANLPEEEIVRVVGS